ncbi:hypothetical protein [Novacetimonas pomaceti]|uniref:hypothetical protein n=1 Tax=Novacetimonas pomaceti TaxID=2021998 RepID=UPI001C2D47ED|nr:hypothetical protein [Novacetimonas pomaceti]MBV1835165.1 hypothetical protein [Novacetimonas pomaceti]
MPATSLLRTFRLAPRGPAARRTVMEFGGIEKPKIHPARPAAMMPATATPRAVPANTPVDAPVDTPVDTPAARAVATGQRGALP